MGKSNTIKSSRLRAGKRTYFFDVNLSKSNQKYLKITESTFVEEGKDRKYNSFVLFPDNVKDFQNILAQSAAALS